jgi:phytoene dehydrogenase-like protein
MTLTESYDVIVFGGGTAGVVAAIQAGRAGAKTLLVEKTGMLGGTMTNGAVNFPGLFHAWGRQVIAGIGWELVSRCVAEAGDTLPDFTDYKRPHWHPEKVAVADIHDLLQAHGAIVPDRMGGLGS